MCEKWGPRRGERVSGGQSVRWKVEGESWCLGSEIPPLQPSITFLFVCFYLGVCLFGVVGGGEWGARLSGTEGISDAGRPWKGGDENEGQLVPRCLVWCLAC